MSVTHTTSMNEALDLICLRHYGQQSGVVEQVLEANPSIASVAHRLPEGLKISLPEVANFDGRQALKLWD
jgi:phage tail protein X